MKLLLDTTNKIIKIEESVNLGELIEALDKLLSSEEWKTFKLETNTQIVWQSPIVIKEYSRSFPYYPDIWPRPYVYPWYNPTPEIIYQGGSIGGINLMQADYALNSGTFCVEV
jgi:hypothetical protein